MSALEPTSQMSLAEDPQRFGLLPTSRFWRDRETRKLAEPLLLCVLAPLGVALLVLDLPVLVGAAAMNVATVLTFGLVERYVRGRITRRAEVMPTKRT